MWETKYAPLLTAEPKDERKGQVTNRWNAGETMIRIKKKLFYLYRAIASHGKLVDVRLSEVRDAESTAAFFEQAAETTGQNLSNLPAILRFVATDPALRPREAKFHRHKYLLRSGVVEVSECREGGLGFPGQVRVGRAGAVLQYLDNPPATHV